MNKIDFLSLDRYRKLTVLIQTFFSFVFECHGGYNYKQDARRLLA